MRTGRSLTVCRSLVPGGGVLQGGVCSWGVWLLPGEGVCSRGVSALGGFCSRGETDAAGKKHGGLYINRCQNLSIIGKLVLAMGF